MRWKEKFYVHTYMGAGARRLYLPAASITGVESRLNEIGEFYICKSIVFY